MTTNVLDTALRSKAAMDPWTPSPTRRVDARRLRWPYEIPAIIVCVVINLGLVVGALALVTVGWEWIEHRPMFAEHKAQLWTLLGFVVLALPMAFVGRHAKLVSARGNSIRVSETQLPELHEILLRECEALGMKEVPDLYVAHELKDVSTAYSVLGARSCVVVGADVLFSARWKDHLDVFAFAIGHGLAAIRLGHTKWWLELLTGYAIRIPFLRTPVLEAYIFSRDRCAAFAVPGGIRGLLLSAASKELLDDADVRAFVDESRSFGGFWAWTSGLATRKTPHTGARVKRLYDAGFFDLERDLTRFDAQRASASTEPRA